MNRSLTNAIRYLMDEWVPPALRDTKWFMYPFFAIAYRGRSIKRVMNFKKLVYNFSDDEYRAFYSSLNTISRNRKTDLNEPCIHAMLLGIPSDAESLLDVGCGRGYFLSRVSETRPDLKLVGCDVVDELTHSELQLQLVHGNVERLPFEDNSFDVVTCSHTLEHILNPQAAIAELKRVARRVLYVAVPCQRYYFYTLDEHVNFYPEREPLMAQMGVPGATCIKLHGDWLYRADLCTKLGADSSPNE